MTDQAHAFKPYPPDPWGGCSSNLQLLFNPETPGFLAFQKYLLLKGQYLERGWLSLLSPLGFPALSFYNHQSTSLIKLDLARTLLSDLATLFSQL